MRLFTHNLLMCNKKGVKEGYPLIIEATTVEERKTDFNAQFLKGLMPKVNWEALKGAALTLKCTLSFPPRKTACYEKQNQIIRRARFLSIVSWARAA